jgi:hypothetical protein
MYTTLSEMSDRWIVNIIIYYTNKGIDYKDLPVIKHINIRNEVYNYFKSLKYEDYRLENLYLKELEYRLENNIFLSDKKVYKI